MELCRNIRKLLGWALVILGSLFAAWGIWLDYKDTQSLGLPAQAWMAIGLVVFVIAVLSILVQFQKQSTHFNLKETHNQETERKAIQDKVQPSSYLKSKKIIIADLARDEPHMTVEDKVFEDCELIGPAIIYITGCFLVRSTFDASLKNMLIEIKEDRIITGGVRFRRCVFQRCEFKNIGIIALPASAKKMKEQIQEKTD